MIELYIDNVNCRISGELGSDKVHELDGLMSYDHPGYMFMITLETWGDGTARCAF
mgnify:CR=1 FL=1